MPHEFQQASNKPAAHPTFITLIDRLSGSLGGQCFGRARPYASFAHYPAHPDSQVTWLDTYPDVIRVVFPYTIFPRRRQQLVRLCAPAPGFNSRVLQTVQDNIQGANSFIYLARLPKAGFSWPRDPPLFSLHRSALLLCICAVISEVIHHLDPFLSPAWVAFQGDTKTTNAFKHSAIKCTNIYLRFPIPSWATISAKFHGTIDWNERNKLESVLFAKNI